MRWPRPRASGREPFATAAAGRPRHPTRISVVTEFCLRRCRCRPSHIFAYEPNGARSPTAADRPVSRSCSAYRRLARVFGWSGRPAGFERRGPTSPAWRSVFPGSRIMGSVPSTCRRRGKRDADGRAVSRASARTARTGAYVPRGVSAGVRVRFGRRHHELVEQLLGRRRIDAQSERDVSAFAVRQPTAGLGAPGSLGHCRPRGGEKRGIERVERIARGVLGCRCLSIRLGDGTIAR